MTMKKNRQFLILKNFPQRDFQGVVLILLSTIFLCALNKSFFLGLSCLQAFSKTERIQILSGFLTIASWCMFKHQKSEFLEAEPKRLNENISQTTLCKWFSLCLLVIMIKTSGILWVSEITMLSCIDLLLCCDVSRAELNLLDHKARKKMSSHSFSSSQVGPSGWSSDNQHFILMWKKLVNNYFFYAALRLQMKSCCKHRGRPSSTLSSRLARRVTQLKQKAAAQQGTASAGSLHRRADLGAEETSKSQCRPGGKG